MTKKDYILIAGTIKQNKVYMKDNINYYMFCRAFGMMLEDENPRFDPIKFLEACTE